MGKSYTHLLIYSFTNYNLTDLTPLFNYLATCSLKFHMNCAKLHKFYFDFNEPEKQDLSKMLNTQIDTKETAKEQKEFKNNKDKPFNLSNYKIYCKDHIPEEFKQLKTLRNKITFEQISSFSNLLKDNWKDAQKHNAEFLLEEEESTTIIEHKEPQNPKEEKIEKMKEDKNLIRKILNGVRVIM